MQRRFFAGEYRMCVYLEERDVGGMFDATVGVWMAGPKYQAFVSDWGGGVKSPLHDTKEQAIADIERLMERYYG